MVIGNPNKWAGAYGTHQHDAGEEDGDGEDGEDGEDDGIRVNVGKDHSIVIQELDAVPYYE